jgi:arginine N-succinyltransferase
MKVVRLVKTSDFKCVENLVKHSGKGMTTMPKTAQEIKKRIAWSESSQHKKSNKPNQDSYLFVLEDHGRIAGLSAIYTSVSLKKPSVFFKKSTTQLKSDSLNFTRDLDVLALHLCKQPYSELGTLFLKPAFRGKGRGSLLSFSRLIFISAHQQRFDPKAVVEIRGFKNTKDESYFWDSFSSTFFNLDFFKADEISYIDNHLIMESIPKFPFIIEHMPKKVQRVIGKPHPNAMPAYSLLRKQNFQPNNLIDVLDGGPCLEAKIDSIPLVKSAQTLSVEVKRNINFDRFGFIANPSIDFFAVVKENYALDASKKILYIPPKTAKALGLETGSAAQIN